MTNLGLDTVSSVSALARRLRQAVTLEEQRALIEALGSRYRELRACNPLRRRLDAFEPELARAAALALGRLGLPAGCPHLVSLLHDTKHPARPQAARALGWIGRRAHAGVLGMRLVALLAHADNRRVRRTRGRWREQETTFAVALVDALGDLLCPEAASWLETALRGDLPASLAQAALRAYARSAQPRLALELLDGARFASSLADAARLAAEQLGALAVLLDEHHAERVVGRLIDAFAMESLEEALFCRNVRRFGVDRFGAALECHRRSTCRDGERLVRLFRLAGMYGHAALVPWVVAALNETRSVAARVAGVRALGEIGAPASIDVLRALYADSRDEAVHVAVAKALADIGGERVWPLLADLVVDAVRRESEALKRAASAGLCAVLAARPRGAVRAIERLANENLEALIPTIAWLVGELRLERCVPLLRARFEANPSAPWQSYTVWALGEIGDDRAIETLEVIAERTARGSALWGWILTAFGSIVERRPEYGARLEALWREGDGAASSDALEQVLRAFIAAGRVLSADLLARLFESTQGEQQLLVLELLRLRGGAKALELAREAFERGGEREREAAARILVRWGDQNALRAVLEAVCDGGLSAAFWERHGEACLARVREKVGAEGDGSWGRLLRRLIKRVKAHRPAIHGLVEEMKLLAGRRSLAARARCRTAVHERLGERLRKTLSQGLVDDLVTAWLAGEPKSEGGLGAPGLAIVWFARALERGWRERWGNDLEQRLVTSGMRARLALEHKRFEDLVKSAVHAVRKRARLDVRASQIRELLKELGAANEYAVSGLRRWSTLLCLAASDWRIEERRFGEALGIELDPERLRRLLGPIKALNVERNRVAHPGGSARPKGLTLERAREICFAGLAWV